MLLKLSLAFILGGAIGNLIDRMFYGIFYGYAPLFYGHVVDFLDFDFFHFTLFGRTFDRWPIFNVADAAVTIGVVILLFFYNQKHREEVKEMTLEASENSEILYSANQENSERDSKDGEADSGKDISL
jgi:signal peptidase II